MTPRFIEYAGAGSSEQAAALLRDLLASSTEHVIVGEDLDGTILLWNEGARRLSGYEPDEVVGKASETFLHPPEDVAEGKLRTIRETVLRQGDWEGALIGVHKTGHRFDLRGIVTPRRDGAGRPAGFLLIATNVRQAASRVARRLERAEMRYRLLVEQIPAVTFMAALDRSDHELYVSPQIEALLGFSQQEWLDDPVLWYTQLHPDDRERWHLEFARTCTTGERFRSEYRFLAHDGRVVWVHGEAQVVRDADGQPVFLQGIAFDVTERKRAEEKFKGLLESAPDAMVIVDRQGRIDLVNSQTELLFGYTREELLGQPLEILVPSRFRAQHSVHAERYFAEPRPRPMGAGLELWGVRKDGSEFPVEVSLSPLETEEGLLVSSSIRDITQRKQAERALQEKNLELEKASRTKNLFLARMSHELRTPLNAILGFTGTLLMKLPGPLNEDQEEQLATIESSGAHLLSLINDLLDLTKIESGKVELRLTPVVCQGVVQEVASTLRPLAQAKGLRLEVLLPERDCVVNADLRALKQILLNLANNAIQFTAQGKIVIDLRQEWKDGRSLTEVRVTDTGVGIKEEDQGRLFRAFEQISEPAHSGQQGTGLGLYLSQKLAGLMGGRIGLTSEFGRGSTFTLFLVGS